MRIEEPTRDDVREVARALRPADIRELVASTGLSGDDLEADLVSRFGAAPNAICAFLDNEPVAVSAVVPFSDDILRIGMFATADFPKVVLPFTKFVMRRLFPSYAAEGFKKVECMSIEGYDEAHRWIATLGLKRGETHEGVGHGGETFIQFVGDL